MNKKLRLKYRLKVLFTPGAWIRIEKCSYDKEWDKILWKSLEDNKIEFVGEYDALINGHIVWIRNSPWGNGSCFPDGQYVADQTKKTCSRATALYLRDQVEIALIIQNLKGPYDSFDIWEKYNIII